jgi:hypothetical protein
VGAGFHGFAVGAVAGDPDVKPDSRARASSSVSRPAFLVRRMEVKINFAVGGVYTALRFRAGVSASSGSMGIWGSTCTCCTDQPATMAASARVWEGVKMWWHLFNSAS